jgi:transposase InsO family protein
MCNRPGRANFYPRMPCEQPEGCLEGLSPRLHTIGSYAFGFLHAGKKPECAAALVHNDILPFYREHSLSVGAVLTDNGREFCGTENHPFELHLALNNIEHRRTKVKSPKTNGFIERFNKTVLGEFYRIVFRENFYESWMLSRGLG